MRLTVAWRAALALLLGAGLGLAASAVQVSAADGSVSATVTPSQIALTPYSSSTVVLVVTNTGPGAVTNLVIDPTPTDSSIAVARSGVGVPASTLSPTSSIELSYMVSRRAEGTGQDVAVLFVMTYVGGSSGAAEAAVTTLDVKAATSPQVVDAKIQSNVTNINENRPGEAILTISNPRQAVISITSIQVTAPNYVDVSLHCISAPNDLNVRGGSIGVMTAHQCPLTVDPLSQQVLHMGLKTTDTVAPGPRTVVVKVNAKDLDTQISASSIATLGLTVDIFAESDVLKSLGVPIFLLLPGFVVIAIVQALLTLAGPSDFGRPRTAGSPGNTSTTALGKVAIPALARTPEAPNPGSSSISSVVAGVASVASLWLVASLFVSIVIARVYPWLTLHGPPFQSRDYTVAYGFRDFYLALWYSWGIGFALWLLIVVLNPLDRWASQELETFWGWLKSKLSAGRTGFVKWWQSR